MHKFGVSKRGAKKDGVPLSERLALSPEEASDLSGIGVTSIRAAVASGELKAHKLGTRTIIPRDNLIAWIKTLPPAATGKKTVSEEERAA